MARGIFKGAKFGDMFLTAGHEPVVKGQPRIKPQKAVFWYKGSYAPGNRKPIPIYVLIVEGEDTLYFYDYTGRCVMFDSEGYIGTHSDKAGEYVLDIVKKL